MNLSADTHAIVGAALEVHKELGPRLLESAYQKCLALEREARDDPSGRLSPPCLRGEKRAGLHKEAGLQHTSLKNSVVRELRQNPNRHVRRRDHPTTTTRFLADLGPKLHLALRTRERRFRDRVAIKPRVHGVRQLARGERHFTVGRLRLHVGRPAHIGGRLSRLASGI